MSTTKEEAPPVDAGVEVPPVVPAPRPSEPAAEASGGAGVRQTPGGVPVVPVAVNAANTAIGAVSAAAMTLGPLALAASAVGVTAAAAGGAALARRNRGDKRNQRRGSGGGHRQDAGRSGNGAGPGLRLGSGNSRTGGAGTGSAGGRGGSGRGTSPGARTGSGSVGLSKSGVRPGSGSGGRSATSRASLGKTGGTGGRSAGGARNSSGMLGAVRDIRRDQRAAGAGQSRAHRHRQQAADRRAVADARRAAKNGYFGGGGLGGLGSGPRSKGGRLRDRAQRARFGAVDALRRRRDDRHGVRVDKARQMLRTAAARRRMRRRLAASWMRYRARCLAAAAVSLPVGVLGLLSTPLGRKLGLPWLMYPGRRLYRVLAGQARSAHHDRIGAALDEARAMDKPAPDEGREIADRVPRAPRNHSGVSVSENTESTENGGPGFLFGEAASEMEAAAQSYDPDGMMQVLGTVEAMPEALTSIANVFQILAERSDSEFPLEPEVGEALSEVYTHLMLAVNAAADVPTTFRNVHEQDIRRHEDPRNNAEDKWDTTNN